MKEIPLTRGYVVLVDDEDYEVVSKWNWYVNLSKNGRICYANRQYRYQGKQVMVAMHRQIMNAPKGRHVDHVDGDGLNNQKINLRFCSHRQNCSNQRKPEGRKGYKGVYKKGRKWTVGLTHKGAFHYLGLYTCRQAAAREYDKLAKLLFGKFANLNFPENN